MKKILLLIIMFFVMPLAVFANDYKTDKFYIDATINNDGSVTFKEFVKFNGSDYNYLRRNLELKGNTKAFVGSDYNSFYETNIYNASGLNDNMCFSSINSLYFKDWEYLTNNDKCFSKISSGYNGLSGKYTFINTGSEIEAKIYNPGSNNQAFYLEYTVNDLVVVHNDVAEMMFNWTWDEFVEDFKIKINLPGPSNELRIYSHGPLNGGNELTNKNGALVYWDFLNANDLIDARIVFDKSLVPNATKFSNVDALDKILEFETIQANKQNEKREAARNLLYGSYIVFSIYMISLLYMVIKFYKKYDKEYGNLSDLKYYRDFPSNAGPEIVGYLLTKSNIKSEYLSASIMELIRKKVLLLEIDSNDHDNFIIRDAKIIDDNLTETEVLLKDWFINELGNGTFVTNKDIKKASKNSYESFLQKYNEWKNKVIAIGISNNYFEENGFKKFKYSLYSFLGIGLFIISTILDIISIFSILTVLLSIVSFIYIIFSQKRTGTGNDEYIKWKALKNFMLDFGKMDEKELPEIHLWERYLVYATTFGIADKVEKAMNMKIKEYYPETNMNNMTFLYFNNYYLASAINNSITSGVSRAISTQVAAASAKASASGFGGGSSFGGGGGGFGGGGGRG